MKRQQINLSKPNERLLRVMLTQNLIFEGGYNNIIASYKHKEENIIIEFINKECCRVLTLDICEFNLLMTLITGDNNIIERDSMCATFNKAISAIFESERVS